MTISKSQHKLTVILLTSNLFNAVQEVPSCLEGIEKVIVKETKTTTTIKTSIEGHVS